MNVSGADEKMLVAVGEQQERRVALAVHARRAGMSPVSLHGRARRRDMGLVETPGPQGVYLTPESSARHIAQRHEVREARRANKR